MDTQSRPLTIIGLRRWLGGAMPRGELRKRRTLPLAYRARYQAARLCRLVVTARSSHGIFRAGESQRAAGRYEHSYQSKNFAVLERPFLLTGVEFFGFSHNAGCRSHWARDVRSALGLLLLMMRHLPPPFLLRGLARCTSLPSQAKCTLCC